MDNKRIGPKQCFLSHSSEDKAFLDQLEDVFLSQFDRNEYALYYTSGERNTTHSGDQLNLEIRRSLDKSDLMIAVITDSYLRSIVGISEISVFRYLDKPVIPIVFDQDGKDFLRELTSIEMIFIDLSDKSPKHISSCAAKMTQSMIKYGFSPRDAEEAEKSFYQLFLNGNQAKAKRRYIGSGENYANIDAYCEKYGVKLFNNTSLPLAELCSKISDCKELFIAATTGANLINALSSEFIPSALAKGNTLTVLLPNRYSAYVSDVAEVESPDNAEAHRERFSREFDSVIYNLKNCLKRAQQISPDGCGEIYIGCSNNLIRQTITLAVWEDRLWGWLSMTIPPKRTVDGTPSLEFSGGLDELSFGRLIYEHILAIRDFSVRKHMNYALSQHEDFHDFALENEGAEAYWRELYQTAKLNSGSRDGEKDLIEVAAQHPLKTNGQPGKEFAKRLDCAAELYRRLSREGREVKIYVPGSTHCYKGKADPCSLSASGVKYLLAAGIPEADLLGENENLLYKGDAGVYNTADECYVASRLFFDEEFSRLHCVCSANQIARKKLFYIAFGVIPFYHTVSTENMAHDDIFELFHSVPEIIAGDHTWQGADSVQGNRTRRERDPRLVFGNPTGQI